MARVGLLGTKASALPEIPTIAQGTFFSCQSVSCSQICHFSISCVLYRSLGDLHFPHVGWGPQKQAKPRSWYISAVCQFQTASPSSLTYSLRPCCGDHPSHVPGSKELWRNLSAYPAQSTGLGYRGANKSLNQALGPAPGPCEKLLRSLAIGLPRRPVLSRPTFLARSLSCAGPRPVKQ